MATLKLRCLTCLIGLLFLLTGCGGGGSSQSANSPPITQPDDPVTQPDDPVTQPDDPVATSPEISSLEIVDTSTLATVQQVQQNDTIDIESLPDNFNIVAVPADETAVESVEFSMEGCLSIERTEIYSPYSLQDESIGLSSLPAGECTITATPYSEDNLGGEEGPEFAVSFEVMENSSPGANSNPTIQLIGDSTVYISYGGIYEELGATATDAEDGNLTSEIQIQGGNINTLIAGTFIITYMVSDSVGAMASVERTAIVGASQAPEITLIGGDTLFIQVNESFVDPGATAFDAQDGDLTNDIETISTVDTTNVGAYQITYSVADNSGETDQVVRDVIVVSEGSQSTNIAANIISMTRVNGVSPETVYFNADESTCSDCTDLWGLNTVEADAYSVLSYHFDFDDSDSGSFATTGNSRNRQVSGSPRAAHTFHCFGSDDPNWDATDRRCEFDVGVRVQAPDGDFDDAFVRVNIQPAVGTGGYYADSDVTCVSSTSEFSDCLALVPGAATATNVPSVGNWDGKLAIIDNNGATYSDVCMGADEQNGAAIAYGPNLVSGATYGSRPQTNEVILSGRPGTCIHTYTSNSDISMLSDNWPERNGNGELIDGFGFGQKVVGMQVGTVNNGPTANFVQLHDIVADEAVTGRAGDVALLSAANFCSTNELSCSALPLGSFVFITDSVVKGGAADAPTAANIHCFNKCSLVNAVIQGTEVDISEQHNIRVMGAYGLILSNNWVRGSHIGGQGPKAQVTIRRAETNASLTTDPDVYTSTSPSFAGPFPENRYIMSIDNWINQASHLSNHDGGVMHLLAGFFTIEDGTTYYADSASASTPKSFNDGVYKTIRNIDWGAGSTTDCGFRTDDYLDGSTYNEGDTFYYEGSPTCSGGGGVNRNTPALSTPLAPSI